MPEAEQHGINLREKCLDCPLQINAQHEIDELTQNGSIKNAEDWENIARINREQCSAGEPYVEIRKRFKYFGRQVLITTCATDRRHGIRETFYSSISELPTFDE